MRLDREAGVIHEGDIVEGRYRITGVLGRGGYGAVYSAEHTGTKQKVAIKMLMGGGEGHDEGEIRRFYREAQVTANLRHPNTVRVFDVGQTQDQALFIAMELLHGPTLEKVLRNHASEGRVATEAEAIDVGIAVLKSLSEAHGQGLVHRDLKPANIMITEVDGERIIKVLDFGIARPQESSLTETGSSLGTPGYMSPEQCRADPIDGRSDLYSLGVILYRCVAGKLPFVHSNPMTLMFMHISHPPPDLAAAAQTPLTQGFLRCVQRALAKDPAERFQSARDMRLALEVLGKPEGQQTELPADYSVLSAGSTPSQQRLLVDAEVAEDAPTAGQTTPASAAHASPPADAPLPDVVQVPAAPEPVPQVHVRADPARATRAWAAAAVGAAVFVVAVWAFASRAGRPAVAVTELSATSPARAAALPVPTGPAVATPAAAVPVRAPTSPPDASAPSDRGAPLVPASVAASVPAAARESPAAKEPAPDAMPASTPPTVAAPKSDPPPRRQVKTAKPVTRPPLPQDKNDERPHLE